MSDTLRQVLGLGWFGTDRTAAMMSWVTRPASQDAARCVVVAAVTMLGAGACGGNSPSAADPPVGVQPGFIEFYDRSTDIRAPASASLGDTVTITVSTYGDGQCITFHSTEVTTGSRSIEVVPLDSFEERTGTWCPDVLVSIKHEARVPLLDRGTVKLRVRGRRWPENTVITADREIVVR